MFDAVEGYYATHLSYSKLQKQEAQLSHRQTYCIIPYPLIDRVEQT